MAITLQEFINKAKEKEANKVKITTLEVEGFGTIEFQRPSDDKMIKYLSDLVKSTKGFKEDKDKNNVEIDTMDLYKFAKVSSEFVYHCCSMMRDKEVRNLYPKVLFEDIPLTILGENEVIRVANKLNVIFKGTETAKEVKEDIKN